MREWLLLPVLAALWILESTLVRGVTLFSGAADVLLLAVIAWAVQPPVGRGMWLWAAAAALLSELGSAMPPGAYLAVYLLGATLAWALRRRAWQSRFWLYLWLVLLVSLLGGLGMYFLLWILHGGLLGSLSQALTLVILPSAFLNLLWALPVYFLVRELMYWVYAGEEVEA